jgi:hypothetical protein
MTSCATISRLRDDPSKIDTTENTSDVVKPVKQDPVSNSVPVEVDTPVPNIATSDDNKARTIEGFIEPDVTQLPDNKDLQESNNVAPKPSQLRPNSDKSIIPQLNDLTDSLPKNP